MLHGLSSTSLTMSYYLNAIGPATLGLTPLDLDSMGLHSIGLSGRFRTTLVGLNEGVGITLIGLSEGVGLTAKASFIMFAPVGCILTS